jgi:hypothetical protein
MGQHAGAPIVMTTPLRESIDGACVMSVAAGFSGGAARLRMLVRVVALLCFLFGGRQLARVVNEHGARGIGDGGSDIAPLLLFALLWVIADSPSPQRVPPAF